jgi:hypothetical protein
MGCDDDIQIKRQVMEILVAGIRVDTKGAGRAKQAHVTISDSFTPKRVVLRVIQFSTEPLTGCISGVIKRFDPREGSPGKAFPHTSQNAWMELLRWYHRHVR